ncbi:MAG: beta-N-acetylhexosaminidase [Armatimonadota bacterium]|nr:beta-N-acetylhexosaminidase [Armatimonadota bacterium]
MRPGLTARRQAGRFCLVDFDGPEPPATLERRIADAHIAGVVLFRKNVRSARQVAALTASLQGTARAAGAPPLLVAIDHEGGAVTRFPLRPDPAGPAMTPLPSAMALGAAGDPALARAAGAVAGAELRALGVHLNFAPVLDVNTNPANPVIGARAFGETAAMVTALGIAYLQGLQAAGVGATAKHFPGHGDTSVDSHLGLPRVDHAIVRLETVELAPFAAAVRAGVAAIMTAHVVYPALDPSGTPATMSAPILAGLLRDRLGYGGLVVSDSLSMRAIADHVGVGEAAVAAVAAGCDLLLALGPPALQDDVLERLALAIERGVLPAARLAAAAARLADALQRRGAGTAGTGAPAGGPGPPDLAAHVGTPAHLDVARRIAEAAVTLVRDPAGRLPLRGRVAVVALGGRSGPAEPVEGFWPELDASLRRHGADAVGRPPDAKDLSAFDRVVAVTWGRGTPEARTVEVWRALHRRVGDRLVVVAAGDPYELAAVPPDAACVATYGPDPFSIDAAAQVLLGRRRARGRLPVTLPRATP